MSEVTLETALAGLARIPQFFPMRLTWNVTKNNYDKHPCFADGSDYKADHTNPKNWHTFATANRIIDNLRAMNHWHCEYGLGFYLTADIGYWFFDVDNCLVDDGALNNWAQWSWDNLPSVMVEWSSSGRGLHFIGKGRLPEHGKRFKEAQLELYTEQRIITFGLTGKAWGNADSEADTHTMEWLIPQYFPPIVRGADGENEGPREDWNGPTDDADLLQRALKSKSAAGVLGGKATFADLWQRNVAVLAKTYPDPGKAFGESEADQALASHLAFWTGCDAPRIERLMRQSALKRDKWDDHSTYLRELTIGFACNSQRDVCRDKPTEQVLPVATSSEQVAASANYMQRITNADESELRNSIIPAIAKDRSIEILDRDRFALLIKDRFAVFQIPVTMNMCRKMLAMHAIESDENNLAVPAFAQTHVYVTKGDIFFNTDTAAPLSRTAFNAQYNRLMPMRANGDREDATAWCLERWGTRCVDDVMYAPGRESTFGLGGRYYANLFNACSLPIAAADYTEQGLAGIKLFTNLLWSMCGARQQVYDMLLSWMAHNVQHPGKKIRFIPLIKGIEGDGKSVIASVMRCAMGWQNVSTVGPSSIANAGGFTDWAEGFAVCALEEIKLFGRDRYKIYNLVKQYISNDHVDINRKGKGPIQIINVTNYLGFTNHTDAVPLSSIDRRWWIIFTPYAYKLQLIHSLALTNDDELIGYFSSIFESLKNHAGEWCKWLREMPIAKAFNPDGWAPVTDEKKLMHDSGEDEYEAIAKQIIAAGAEGVTANMLSSSCLSLAMKAVCIADGLELPKTTTLNHLLIRLGFAQIGVFKWRSKTHRVWSQSTRVTDSETVRKELDSSASVTSYEYEQL